MSFPKSNWNTSVAVNSEQVTCWVAEMFPESKPPKAPLTSLLGRRPKSVQSIFAVTGYSGCTSCSSCSRVRSLTLLPFCHQENAAWIQVVNLLQHQLCQLLIVVVSVMELLRQVCDHAVGFLIGLVHCHDLMMQCQIEIGLGLFHVKPRAQGLQKLLGVLLWESQAAAFPSCILKLVTICIGQGNVIKPSIHNRRRKRFSRRRLSSCTRRSRHD